MSSVGINRVRKSLKLSILDGAAFSAMAGLTQNYLSAFALALKATTAQIGLLASIPQLMMALGQLLAPDLSERAGTRKRLILPTVFLHAITFIPILLIPFLFPTSPVSWLIGLATLNTVLGALANPAWGSMMADLVPVQVRGRYFSKRGRISGFIALTFSFAAGAILQFFSGNIFTGFAILFTGATVFRLLSFYFLAGMYEPPPLERKSGGPSFATIIRNLPSTKLGKFSIYVALISLCTNIASPFFTVYMLRDVKVSYVIFTLVFSAGPVANMVFQPLWGKRADLAGNMKVIRVTSMLVPFIPIVWLMNTNTFYLMGAETLSGLAWSGFMLATTNYVYDAAAPAERTKQIAFFNALNGMAVCVGALIGGYIAPHLPSLMGYQLRTLFALSGILRGAVVVLLLHTLAEVRPVRKLSFGQFVLGRWRHTQTIPATEPDSDRA